MDRIKEKLSAVGDAIREKTGKSDLLNLDEMPAEIAAIETGIKTDDATAVASDILSGKTAYINDSKVTGTFSLDTELNTQDDLISQIQTALQNKASASEPVLQTKTVTPTTNTQNITPDSGYDGLSKVTVNGDVNLKAENIKSGVSIFGVSGNYVGSGGGGSVAIETCSGCISFEAIPVPLSVTYTNNNLVYQTINVETLTNLEIVKNTIVFISGGICNAKTGCTRLGGGTGSYAYLITANNFEIKMPM